MFKIDKVMMIIAFVLLLILVIIFGYIFITQGFKTLETQKKVDIGEGSTLNINKDKVIENPTEQDIQNLIDRIESQRETLGEEGGEE